MERELDLVILSKVTTGKIRIKQFAKSFLKIPKTEYSFFTNENILIMKKQRVNLKTSIYVKQVVICLVFLFGFFHQGITQSAQTATKEKVATNLMENPVRKNSIRTTTPLKALISQRMNIAYERHVYKSIYATAGAQFWFQDRSPSGHILGNPRNHTLNKGIRYSLGARYYHNSHNRPTSFYFGASIFYGQHRIEETQGSESGFLSQYNTSGQFGADDLTSQGVIASIGLHRTFGKVFYFDLGLNVGKAWTNTGKDTITLYPTMDRKEESIERNLPRNIAGKVLEPMLSIGFNF